jgi:hypothetical protein
MLVPPNCVTLREIVIEYPGVNERTVRSYLRKLFWNGQGPDHGRPFHGHYHRWIFELNSDEHLFAEACCWLLSKDCWKWTKETIQEANPCDICAQILDAASCLDQDSLRAAA